MTLWDALRGFAGGLMIGIAAAIMLLGLGRIAGISGLLARAAGLGPSGSSRDAAAAFVLGLPLGAALMAALGGAQPIVFPDGGWPRLVAAGLLVGLGTRLGSGCTSGHGVCGLSRLSPRSLAATATFMAVAAATVTLLRLAGLP